MSGLSLSHTYTGELIFQLGKITSVFSLPLCPAACVLGKQARFSSGIPYRAKRVNVNANPVTQRMLASQLPVYYLHSSLNLHFWTASDSQCTQHMVLFRTQRTRPCKMVISLFDDWCLPVMLVSYQILIRSWFPHSANNIFVVMLTTFRLDSGRYTRGRL